MAPAGGLCHSLRQFDNPPIALLLRTLTFVLGTEIQELRRIKGIALIDVVRELHPYIDKIDFPTETKIQLLDALADLEYSPRTATPVPILN